VLQLGGWRPRWHTALVLVSVLVVLASVALSGAGLAPMVVTTVAAVCGGTGFVLGVSASISAFLERDAHADSDFWR
jgi:hypothetical protein